MPTHTMLTTPFSVHPGRDAAGFLSRAAAIAAPVMDPLLGLTTLHRLYAGLPDGNFIDRALERLDITITISDEHLRRLPATGPVIVVANHPTGAVDGLALAQSLLRRRSDVRLLGNHLLSRVPEMRAWTIAVNPFDPRSSVNRQGLRDARAWLLRGGVLVVFPAGEVSSVADEDGLLVDPAWQRGVLGLSRWSAAPVVPAFIDARSSRWFRLAGLIHPRLRTALLPRELLRLRRRTVGVRLAEPVSAERLSALGDTSRQLAYLRARTYALEPARSRRNHKRTAAVVPCGDESALRHEIAALAPHHELLRSGPYSVYCAMAPDMPSLLREIGRLREITFRAVGEGTGRAIDLDRFDRTYLHLFVWNHDRNEIAGAYRIGPTDRVCRTNDVRGLYTHTLFAFGPGFLEAMGPALELGRSFVRGEYQRESNVLLLLWKGIGAFVARHPRYRRLFGPVSISADYSQASRTALAQFLGTAGLDADWRPLVRPRRPPVALKSGDGHLLPMGATLDDVDALVKEFEDGRGVPVLVRQYWKLGARVLGVSIDPAFGGSLDGLMMVDLAALPAAMLQRYLGKSGATSFQRCHRPG